MGVPIVVKWCWLVTVAECLTLVISASTSPDAVRYPPCVFNPLCSCSKSVPDLGLVFCRDVPLPRLPPPINSSKVFMLHLENNGLRSIEPYFLQGTGLYRLEISHNPLPSVPDEAFLGLERSLWELELQYNDLTTIPSRAMRHLQKLRLLDLTGNEIWEVAPESWRGLENSLQTLILAENSLLNLPRDAFSSLPLLETLDLRGNHFSVLDVDVFRAGPPRLSRLLLADNQLSNVPYQQLSSLRMLRTLDLSSNRITRLHDSDTETQAASSLMSLDTLRLEYNQIEHLPSRAFQHFDILNRTYLDGNPLVSIQSDAFRDSRIRELSLRGCRLSDLSTAAFAGLEATLQWLDLGTNNLTDFPRHLFHEFDFLRTLTLKENKVPPISPADSLNGFQYSIYRLDVSGPEMGVTSLQDLRRMRNLRSLSLSRLPQPHLSSEDFLEFGVDLEELRVINGGLKAVKNHAFRHVRGLKTLDLSENQITQFENEAFMEVGHSLLRLRVSHGLDASVSNVPAEALRPLVNLQHLDFSNNRIRVMPETSFHFLKRLQVLELQDNEIDTVHKGTFQGGIHGGLEELHLSFNTLQSVNTHTFVDLPSLQWLHLDDNKISRIERRAFMNLDRLKRLDLRGNKLHTISDEAFQNLPELELLDLAYNQLQSLDFSMLDQVGTLSSFRLNVSHNLLQRLEQNATAGRGSEVAMLHSNVKVLLLSRNWLTDIPTELFRFTTGLRVVDLSHNRLRSLPDSLFSDENMERLDVSHNLLSRPPVSSLGPAAAATLCEFDLSWNSIAALSSPDAFSRFKSLTWLDLSHNRLVRIEDSTFSSLNHLSFLDLSHNPELVLETRGRSFKGLEDSLLELRLRNVSLGSVPDLPLPALRTLRLSDNHIEDIPAEMASNLTSLRRLDVSYNQLQAVPSAARSMNHLKYLELAANPITTLSSASFQGAMEYLQELDIRHLTLNYFEPSALNKMTSLRTLYMSPYEDVRDFNIPQVIEENAGLRNLHLHVLEKTDLQEEMSGHLPTKVRNITISGPGLTSVPHNLFKGVRSPRLHLALRNTSVETLPKSLFEQTNWVKNLSLDVRNNSLHVLGNPNTGEFPGAPRTVFLTELQMEGNKWTCDCQLGWVEVWQRKKRQYLCPSEKRDHGPRCQETGAIEDDLREAQCENRNNASLLEVLKSEVECGWGSRAPNTTPSWLIAIVVAVCVLTSAGL
ncbi:chaoptin isoform X2 [Periplaneta americana]|uniref:chaoptin isoform X2 n=1 Tax=Periplaneta americana TaxID=6978 RepID=UPI0037E7FD97